MPRTICFGMGAEEFGKGAELWRDGEIGAIEFGGVGDFEWVVIVDGVVWGACAGSEHGLRSEGGQENVFEVGK